MAPHHQIRPGIDILPCQRSLVFLRLCIPLDSPVYIDDKVIALPLCRFNLIKENGRVVGCQYPGMGLSGCP